MAPQRYERVAGNADEDLPTSPAEMNRSTRPQMPSSPPPSFRSRLSSRRTSISHLIPETAVERDLEDAFGGPHDSDEEDAAAEEQRLVSTTPTDNTSSPGNLQRRVTELPASTTIAPTTTRVYGGGSGTRDGVFANISAKPSREEELEEKPPTYEQAAADATPPYWETTILAPAGYSSDDIFVDGLIVGSLFSFFWNALISMSFQLIGFLLTYLLHNTHAAKHGSRAGLGITLLNYGFTMRGALLQDGTPTGPAGDPDAVGGVPPDPNEHNFDPNTVAGGAAAHGWGNFNEWLSYILMIAGWFILIRAASDYVRARRQEQLIRNSPDRGLPVPIIAEGEGENAV